MKLAVKNINKKFGRKEILNNINFEISQGEIISIVGRNGSGKTTLLKLISGIYTLDGGEIEIDRKNIEKNNLKGEIIYIPDKFEYFKHSKIKNAIKYYELAYDNFDKEFLEDELRKNKIDLTKRISELSKGQLTIFSIILGISCKTKFLLLDEPLDGIDVVNIKLVIDYILDAQDSGVGILVSSHQLNYLENISDKIIYLGEANGEVEQINKENYTKFQLVYNDSPPKSLLDNPKVKIVSNIGRVYVAIIRGNKEEARDYIQSSELLQYDELPVLLEDIFLLNNKGGEEDV